MGSSCETVQTTIDALVKNGIRDIIVVVGYRKEQVIRFLNELNVPITVVVQDKQIGTAHALNCAKSHITGDFLLLPAHVRHRVEQVSGDAVWLALHLPPEAGARA